MDKTKVYVDSLYDLVLVREGELPVRLLNPRPGTAAEDLRIYHGEEGALGLGLRARERGDDVKILDSTWTPTGDPILTYGPEGLDVPGLPPAAMSWLAVAGRPITTAGQPVSVADLVKRFGCASRPTVANWVYRRDFPQAVTDPGTRPARWNWDEVHEWAMSRGYEIPSLRPWIDAQGVG